MTPADEVLVDLVGCCVEPADEDRKSGPGERALQESAENGVLAQVRELAQDEVPRAEACAETRHRGEREDDRRHEDDGRPEAESCCRHHPMIGSSLTRERGEGIRCKSGTVPPL